LVYDLAMSYLICALYKFAPCPDFEAIRAPIKAYCAEQGILGTLLLAPEGINGTVAGPEAGIHAMVDWLLNDPLFAGRFQGAEIKYASSPAMPFSRLKVRLKREIVTLRAPEADPTRAVGTYVAPKDWNDLIADPEIVLVDTRNSYEVEEGQFKGAIDPRTESFTEFKDWVAQNLDPARDKKVAMYCTGGIRCEKASSYLLAHGFEQVYHLKGGILAYMEQVPMPESTFEGACFVFDQRGAVEPGAPPRPLEHREGPFVKTKAAFLNQS
jgi:UPF0176 protein